MGCHTKEGERPSLDDITPELRAAREAAASTFVEGSIPHRAILGGQWDEGAVVGAYMPGRAG